MKKNTDITGLQEDIIKVRTAAFERQAREARYTSTYVHREKLTLGKLMDTYPRLVMIGIAPTTMIIVSIVSELLS